MDEVVAGVVPEHASHAAGTTATMAVERPRSLFDDEQTDRSVAAYRTAHALRSGPFPQVQGLLDDDVARALADPRTVVVSITDPAGGTTRVPMFTPIDLAPWYSDEYRSVRFKRDLSAGSAVWHLSTFPGLADDEFFRVFEVAVRIVEGKSTSGCIVFADHADRADDPSTTRLTNAFTSTLQFEEVNVRSIGPAREHYLAGRMVALTDPDDVQVIDLRTTVKGPTTDPVFLDELWTIYEAPFRNLSAQSPLRSHFERDELADAISRRGVIQTEHRVDGRLVSWMMMTNDLRSFPWMDPEAFRAAAPDLSYDNIWVFRGVVTDETYRGQHCIQQLIDTAGAAMCRRAPEHLVVFEAVDENALFLPDLIAASVNATGFMNVEFHEVGAQVHRAWKATR